MKSASELNITDCFDYRKRSSALSPTADYLHFNSSFRVEVNEMGILLCPNADGSIANTTNGLLIRSSEHIKVTCAMPAAVVITVLLHEADRSLWDEDALGSSTRETPRKGLQGPWLWLGDGAFLKKYTDQYRKYIRSLPIKDGNISLKISFACSDRSQRDILSLVCRGLCTFTVNKTTLITKEQRLQVLPWHCSSSISSVNSDEEDHSLLKRLKV